MIVSFDRADEVQVVVSVDEYHALHSGLLKTLEALEEWEFGSRTGFEPDEFRALLGTMPPIERP